MKILRNSAAFALLVLGGSLAISAQQGPPAQRGAAPIRLKSAQFTPASGEQPRIPPGQAIAGYAEGQRGYFIVQFAGPVLESWKVSVANAGGELLDYIPDFAFKVRMNPAQAAAVERLNAVAWVGLFHPAYKLDPNLQRDGARPYTIRIERGADAGAAAAQIAATGAQLLSREGLILTVVASSDQVDAIAHVLDVASVENLLLRKKNNEYGGGLIGAGTANTNGFDGSTQIVSISDTGLGNGTASNAFVDIPSSRINSIFNWPGAAGGCFATVTDDGAIDVDSGHGTHTTTSMTGSGGPTGEGRGTAPAAHLIFQALENWATTTSLCKTFYGLQNGYYLVGIPANIGALFQQAYDGGARVHSNSWGSDSAGAYTTDSVNADRFVWDHRQLTVAFSAGNAGADADANGVIDLGSIGSPATAKNVISVGASENDRQGHYECDPGLTYTSCMANGGQNNIFTYGSGFGYPANPIKNDPSAGNGEQMAAFSSRGPASDGRIKPDVVAPGTWVLSGYSDLFQQQYDPSANPQNGVYQYDGWGFPLNQNYKYMGGTSMATPLVAGGAAVVRDYYQKTATHAASAALVKATIINTAEDLLDENNDGLNDNANPIPNQHEGWGRVDLAAATSGTRQFFDETGPLSTGGVAPYGFSIASSGSPLKVTLVWSDYPSTTAAAKNLVNDLDLEVTAPDGTTVYRGNVFAGGWSQTGGSFDRTNNVENVFIPAAPAGGWWVRVRGFNIPLGPQSFAVIVSGDFGAPPPPVPPNAPGTLVATATSSSTINLTWADNSSNEDGFNVERCATSGCTNFATLVQLGPNASGFTDTGLAAGSTYTYRVWAYNTAGASDYSNSAEATTPTAPVPPAAPSNLQATTASTTQINLTWTDNAGDESGFNIERCQGAGCSNFAAVAQVGANVVNFSDTGRAASTTYVYRVRAFNAAGSSAYSNTAQATTLSPPSMHVGDLDGTRTLNGNNWRATINITVHNEADGPVGGVTVTGSWSGGDSGSASCVTSSAGTCVVQSGQMKRNTTNSVTFTVTNATHSSLVYRASSNHDPDGDSNGTVIVVLKP